MGQPLYWIYRLYALNAAKTYAVIGANGCGKSTFARILAGLCENEAGKSSANNWTGGWSIGFLPQRSYAFHMSVLQNLMLNRGVDKPSTEGMKRAEELHAALKLTELARAPAKKLSGGETAANGAGQTVDCRSTTC